MDFTEEWKSQFPVGKLFTPPLLLSGPSSMSRLGPLFFNPNPQTLTLLFSSRSLCPPFLSPTPRFSLARFLSTSSLPLSTSSSIASQLEPQHHNDIVSDFTYNRLQLLYFPNKKTIIAFFPTGYNHDQLGFLVLSFKDPGFDILAIENEISIAKNRFNSRICKLLVNQVENISSFEGNSLVIIGYLLVCTMYSVHWFSVEVSEVSEKPTLNYLGFKLFKSCSVVNACWSQHLSEESVVLLQSGALFMFDMNSHSKTQKRNICFKGKRLRVPWNDDLGGSQICKWLGCEFSWHPRILIIARTDAVFLVDFRCENYNISLLVKIDMLSLYAPVAREQFIAFCKAGSDGFKFVLASDSLMILCDVRKPLMPVLQWAHGLHRPSFVDLFKLSDLRSKSRNDMYEWANELGFGIILGSFWSGEFSLFCYGPSPSGGEPFASKSSKVCKFLYAWELPSDLLLSGRDCCCGSCLVRQGFRKDALPKWINQQHKKDMVLGFGILNRDIYALHDTDEFGGFTLVRLMSSGKLEAQRYCASWDLVKTIELTHGDSLLPFEYKSCFTVDHDFKFIKRYKYFKFDYLYRHLSGNLTEVLHSKLKNIISGSLRKGSFSIDSHEILCKMLRDCGFSRLRASPTVSFVLSDISLPTSTREVALRRIWTGLPMELLQLAFSNYTEVLEVLFDQKKVSLEFLAVPDLPQLPPFFLRKPSSRSNKWSQKVQHSDAIVGPVLPLSILVTLQKLQTGLYSEDEADRFSPVAEFGLCCDSVKQVTSKIAVLDSTFEFDNDHAVSLADDRDEMWVDSQKPKPFILYHPTAFEDHTLRNCVYKDARFANLISKVSECEPFHENKVDNVAPDMFDDLCPIALKYGDRFMGHFPLELKTYNVFKRQFSRWQKGFSPYQEFCSQFKLR